MSPAVNTVVRYNQRGVQGSAGRPSVFVGRGGAEARDLVSVYQAVLHLANPPKDVYVIGMPCMTLGTHNGTSTWLVQLNQREVKLKALEV